MLTFVAPAVTALSALVAQIAAEKGGGPPAWVAFGVLVAAYPVVLRITWNRGDDG